MKLAPAAALALCLAALATDPSHPAPAASQGNPVADISLASLSATRERPLFSPSRRPPPVAAVAPDAPAPQPPRTPPALRLLGTVIGPSDRVAVVAEGADPPASLHVGETALGWTLRSLGPRSATFEGFGGSQTLEIIPAAPLPTDAPPSSDQEQRPPAEGSP